MPAAFDGFFRKSWKILNSPCPTVAPNDAGWRSERSNTNAFAFPTAVGKAKAFVFDLSDLQPASFGATVGQGEFKIFQDFLKNPSNAAGIAKSLESSAAKAYKSGK